MNLALDLSESTRPSTRCKGLIMLFLRADQSRDRRRLRRRRDIVDPPRRRRARRCDNQWSWARVNPLRASISPTCGGHDHRHRQRKTPHQQHRGISIPVRHRQAIRADADQLLARTMLVGIAAPRPIYSCEQKRSGAITTSPSSRPRANAYVFPLGSRQEFAATQIRRSVGASSAT